MMQSRQLSSFSGQIDESVVADVVAAENDDLMTKATNCCRRLLHHRQHDSVNIISLDSLAAEHATRTMLVDLPFNARWLALLSLNVIPIEIFPSMKQVNCTCSG